MGRERGKWKNRVSGCFFCGGNSVIRGMEGVCVCVVMEHIHVPSREMISGHSFHSLFCSLFLYFTSSLYINGTQQVLILIFLVSEIKER